MAEKIISIGVHIWTPGKVAESAGRPEIENNLPYVAERTRRLAQGPTDQILLIVDNFFFDTKDRLSLGSEWDDYIIRTYIGSPRPATMDFKQLRAFILKYPGDGYEFWGTELYLKKGKPDKGCVKGAHDNLRLPNSRINIASSWTAPTPKGNPWKDALAGALSPGWLMP